MRGLWRIRQWCKRVTDGIRLVQAENAVNASFRASSAPRHGAPGELVISLTSYPPRFKNLHKTLRSLLRQSVRADRVVLFIAHADMAILPAAVYELEAHGLTILGCEDLKSYKKLLPALTAWPDATVVTADDDVFYPATWLARLVESHLAHPDAVIAHRAHMALTTPHGSALPYMDWEMATSEGKDRLPGALLFPTGVGGVLYPPGALATTVADCELALRLCPRADDVWFFWMARLAGTRHILARHPISEPVAWLGSQDVALFKRNWRDGAYDLQIQAMERRFAPLRALAASLSLQQAGA